MSTKYIGAHIPSELADWLKSEAEAQNRSTTKQLIQILQEAREAEEEPRPYNMPEPTGKGMCMEPGALNFTDENGELVHWKPER